MKKVFITILSALAIVSMADTNTVAKAMDSVQYIVYTHAGTGRIVELPEPGKTNFLDHGAVAVLSDGTVLELNPGRINAPKLADTIWVTINGKEYSMPRPGPGQTRKFYTHGHTYRIDHNGGVERLADKNVPIGGMSAQAKATAKSMPRPSTNSLDRLPTRRLAHLLELHKLAAQTNAASAEKVLKIEAIMEARTNKQSKASGIVTADNVEVTLPADATFGEPDPQGMDHAYYHGNTRPPLPGEEDKRARLRRSRQKANQ